jgi:hypothetical protein
MTAFRTVEYGGIMNEEPQRTEPVTGETIESAPNQLTISQAAEAIGVDSFTILSLIQRAKLKPARSPSGEIMVPKDELLRLIKKGR